MTCSHTFAVYDRRSGTRRRGRKAIQTISDGFSGPVPAAASANTAAEVHDGSRPPAPGRTPSPPSQKKRELEEMTNVAIVCHFCNNLNFFFNMSSFSKRQGQIRF